MTDLRARILERLDQLEALAQSASAYGEHWAPDCQDVDGDHIDRVVGDGDEEDPTVIYADGRAINHIATWDPAAVLALTAGARQIIDVHAPDHDHDCVGCGWREGSDYAMRYDVDDCPTLAAVARMLDINPDQ